MPGCDGLEATRRIKREFADTTIVMLTVCDEEERLFEAIRCGAQGYLLKKMCSKEILTLLRGAVQGEAAITPALAGRMLEEFRRLSREQPWVPNAEVEPLTAREREVLTLVAEGAADKEIAVALTISLFTVKSHMRHILAKLQVSGRREAARYARCKGLV
jgi:DNA-binding NarL/FixJ family response regulator